MDQQQFDNLARAFATGVSRRRMLKAVVGGGTASLLRAGGVRGADRCRGDGHRCGDGTDCCSEFCLDYDPVTRHRKVCATCTEGTVACNGACVPACPDGQAVGPDCTCGCGEGTVACGGGCVPPCPDGLALAEDCSCPCAEGTVACGDSCVAACPGGQVLTQDCTCGCAEGATACGGTCVPTCPDGQELDESCACVCKAGTVECGDICVPICAAGLIFDGACACVCEATGQPPCGGVCCLADASCVEGTCQTNGGTCPDASRCGSRHYCNDEQTCICVQTPDGDNRCGRVPTSCDVPLCQSNADCAHLGEGYFCDTPHSGCCTDPPAELSRCIAPCEAPLCPAERDCGETCCPVGQQCVEGACVSPNSCDGSICLGNRCGDDADVCLCTSSVEGTGFCLDGFKASCDLYSSCTASSECPDGLCLALADCCGGVNLCVPLSAACPSGTGSVRPWGTPAA